MESFRFRELDLSKWVINKNHPTCVYDLIGVSNHYGGLGGGHCKWFGFYDWIDLIP